MRWQRFFSCKPTNNLQLLRAKSQKAHILLIFKRKMQFVTAGSKVTVLADTPVHYTINVPGIVAVMEYVMQIPFL